MSFPPGTEMFQFSGFASLAGYPCGWVAPFGNLRIKVCSQLPEAYRSVPRPSSPLDAKASVRSPYALDRSQQNSCLGPLRASSGYSSGPTSQTCALSLPDNDVFTRSPLSTLARRDNPSLHNVIKLFSEPHPRRSTRRDQTRKIPSA